MERKEFVFFWPTHDLQINWLWSWLLTNISFVYSTGKKDYLIWRGWRRERENVMALLSRSRSWWFSSSSSTSSSSILLFVWTLIVSFCLAAQARAPAGKFPCANPLKTDFLRLSQSTCRKLLPTDDAGSTIVCQRQSPLTSKTFLILMSSTYLVV